MPELKDGRAVIRLARDNPALISGEGRVRICGVVQWPVVANCAL